MDLFDLLLMDDGIIDQFSENDMEDFAEERELGYPFADYGDIYE